MKPVIGIDLGTTHCAVAIANPETGEIETLPIAQLLQKGTMGNAALLPSFLYLAHRSDGELALPWTQDRDYAVGEIARAKALETPDRVVSSAKSWLCHPAMDRRAPILPPRTTGAPDDVARVSPVEASFRYLEHLVEALSHNHNLDLQNAEVVLTVPASFDAAARELTIEAAFAAGLTKVTLLEEPQAAVYAWLHHRGEAWRKELKVADRLLVCDVGGGTTDFSMILVSEESGNLALERVLVGDHILLGGDNMDLYLAHVCQEKLEADLDPAMFAALTQSCRVAKEKLLGPDAPPSVPIAVAKRGSKLVGNTLRTELTQEDLTRVLLEGFFPDVAPGTAPTQPPRAGLRAVGLPYAHDAAVTRHLSAFLTRARGKAEEGVSGGGAPTAVLFNGGVMKAAPLRARVLGHLARWSEGEGAMRELPFADYDLAVARGAAAYGLSRLGRGVRIRAGAARSYYVGVEPNTPAIPGVEQKPDLLCVAPFGMEEGTSVELADDGLGLVVGEPVSFRFFSSSIRRDDPVGTRFSLRRVKDASELVEMAPLRMTLTSEGRASGDLVPVKLSVELTEMGTLKLYALPRESGVAAGRRGEAERWELELSVREG